MIHQKNHALLWAKKRIVPVGMTVFMVTSALCGCGQRDENVTSVTVDKEGKVTYLIYEEFGNDYYDLQELSDMAAREISEYNSEYISEKTTLESIEKVEQDNGSYVKMVMSFDSSEDFTNFNQESLFYGTVEEARDKGYLVSDKLVDKNGETIPSSYLDEHSDAHVIIITDKIRVLAPFNIEFMTKGVKLSGKKEAELTDTTADTVQLLLSK